MILEYAVWQGEIPISKSVNKRMETKSRLNVRKISIRCPLIGSTFETKYSRVD